MTSTGPGRALRSLTWLVFLLIVGIGVAACRSGPPPTPNSDALASRRQDVTGQYTNVVVIDSTCSSFTNKNDQVVCITNKGQSAVKLGKWLIRNTIGRTYYLPDNTVLDAGKSLKVHTGAGTNSATDLYWNYEFKPVFDTKDQITLVDVSDVEVSKFTTP